MAECFKCGVSGERARLFDAIGDEGIVQICEKCSFGTSIPVIRKPTDFQIKKAEKTQTVYEKLAGVAGIDVKKHQGAIYNPKTNYDLDKQDTSLRDIVDRNFNMNLPEKSAPDPNLIDNFHWVIMRARRSKKLTQFQFAKELAEPIAAIRMAEQGILPEDNYKILHKIENFLGINLMRREIVKMPIQEKFKEIGFDKSTTRALTISDIKRMNKEREEDVFTQEPTLIEEGIEDINLINQDIIDIDEEDLEGVSEDESEGLIFKR